MAVRVRRALQLVRAAVRRVVPRAVDFEPAVSAERVYLRVVEQHFVRVEFELLSLLPVCWV